MSSISPLAEDGLGDQVRLKAVKEEDSDSHNDDRPEGREEELGIESSHAKTVPGPLPVAERQSARGEKKEDLIG
jgi:hypothetical protein